MAKRGHVPWNKGKRGIQVAWNKGIAWSEDAKKKISEATLGRISPRKGVKLTDETKEKIRKANLGKKYPDGANKKKGRTGRIISSETRAKISIGRKGKKVKFTDEWRRKQSERKGERAGGWIDGRTPINHRIRGSIELQIWRKAIFERDNFTCQKTGKMGGYLIAHHINNFAEFPELRTSMENGITLSKESHIEFHNKYGRKNNTKEQLQEFLESK